MGMLNSIKRLYSLGFETLGDVATEATFTHKQSSGYDPSTGEVTTTETSVKVKGIVTKYKTFDRNSGYPVVERRFVCFVEDLGDYTPDPETDTVTINGVEYNVAGPTSIEATGTLISIPLEKVD